MACLHKETFKYNSILNFSDYVVVSVKKGDVPEFAVIGQWMHSREICPPSTTGYCYRDMRVSEYRSEENGWGPAYVKRAYFATQELAKYDDAAGDRVRQGDGL